jgi:hypothetical protein
MGQMPNDKMSKGKKRRKDKMSNGTKRRIEIMSKVRNDDWAKCRMSKVINIECASLLIVLIQIFRNIKQTIRYCIINPRIFNWRNLPMSTSMSLSVSVSMRNAEWDIISNGKKCLLEIMSKVINIEYA